ncbi:MULTISPECIES: LysR family transcriptional regulator [Ralstonia solanacearum species complex]|uniref:Transcriptional regulators, LysR family n=5 Tax=Ralstonia solanacearum TaxID=305 RepID=A0AB33VFT2_RALSU|nr:LysR family transcriptional regulator [Ralstonia solanacearum]ALF90921.1 HTH-type transcriptional regulator GltC [Ralstonia solanacearum]ATI30341.1 LysR family transcriptional regulator [Ralstonia solanacearum]ATJ89080.1 LysR family transcriptional regulator [Ralstonia solanacearum]EAP72912.1 Transcriptional regulators, LysR family [Ralstonia solanacearum UW551]KEI30296.1 LysR family transcriptional regulator [Ralstonia solanacearum]
MRTISLHHLHVFAGVAAAGGVRRSSETLHRASSAIARSVAALEAALGVALFERKGRGMLLTRAGEIVLLRAQQIEAALREVREDAVRSRQGGPVAGLEALHNERRLEVAALLAEVHHMPSVAAALGISQSAVSQAVARLEDALAQPLFVRTARGMVPTDAGSRWIVRFERVLSELRHIHADIAALQGVLEGTVTIGALPLGRTQLLPAAIAEVHARHPRLHFRSLESPYEELTAGLLSGRIDCIIGALRPLHSQGLTTEVLFEDRIAIIVRASHPLAAKKRLGLRDLDGYPWVLSRAGSPLREALDAVFARQGLPQPQPLVETGDLALVRGLLLRGDMVTALSAHQLHYEIEAGWLRALDLPMPDMARGIGITTRMGARLSPGADALLAEIRRLALAWR